MITSQTKHAVHQGRVLKALVGFAATALLSACGGADTVAAPEATVQQQREAAALQRAHQLNADTMSKIKAERAGRQAQQTN